MKQSLRPFKIKVRFLSRAGIIRAAQEGEDVRDQTIQVWGADIKSAANEWGMKSPNSIYGIFAVDGTILFWNGGDHPIQ